MPDEPTHATYRVAGPRGTLVILAVNEDQARGKYCNETAFPVERAAELEVSLTEE